MVYYYNGQLVKITGIEGNFVYVQDENSRNYFVEKSCLISLKNDFIAL